MTPFGLLRVCSAAALAAGSIGVAMPAAADNKCNVRYSATEVVFTSCAAEERACEARGFIYGTTKSYLPDDVNVTMRTRPAL